MSIYTQIIVNALVAIFGASLGAYLGYYFAKKLDKTNQKKIYINLLKGLLAEFESNKKCFIKCSKENISPNEFCMEKTPISFEVFKEFQSDSIVYNFVTEKFMKEITEFISKLRRFKGIGYFNDSANMEMFKKQIKNIKEEIKIIEESNK